MNNGRAASELGNFLQRMAPRAGAVASTLNPAAVPVGGGVVMFNQQHLVVSLHNLWGVGMGRPQSSPHIELLQMVVQNAQKRQEELISQINQGTASLLPSPGTNSKRDKESTEPHQQEIQQRTESPDIPAGDHSDEASCKLPPGVVVASCRARGMPRDHNCMVSTHFFVFRPNGRLIFVSYNLNGFLTTFDAFFSLSLMIQTGYFVIPKEIAHGEGLQCSHAACRNKGVRFRYCSVCSLPVAKRNFSTRHHHGDLVELSIKREKDLLDLEHHYTEDTDFQAATALYSRPFEDTPINKFRYVDKVVIEGPPYSHYVLAATSQHQSSQPSVAHKESKRKRRRTGTHDKKNNAAKADTRVAEDSSGRQQWASLMMERPRNEDGDAMSAWLMQVMAVSEKERQARAAKRTSPSSSAASRSEEEEEEEEEDTSSGDASSSPSPGKESREVTTSSTSRGSDSGQNNKLQNDTLSDNGEEGMSDEDEEDSSSVL
jgi:hypothetical protein